MSATAAPRPFPVGGLDLRLMDEAVVKVRAAGYIALLRCQPNSTVSLHLLIARVPGYTRVCDRKHDLQEQDFLPATTVPGTVHRESQRKSPVRECHAR